MNTTGDDNRMKSGTRFIEMIWYITAENIVKTAISHFNLDNEKAAELERIYLRPNDYIVVARESK